MNPWKAVIAALVGTSVLGAPLPGSDADVEHKSKKSKAWRDWTELPSDASLPALKLIRERGLAAAIPALGLDGRPVQVRLCGYTAGRRATLEVRDGDRRFAVKVCAQDPALEAELYQALAGAGLGRSERETEPAGDSSVRVPPLLFLDRAQRVLATGWLHGPTVNDLVKQGKGERAGHLAARWFQRTASLSVTLGSPLGAAQVMDKVGDWVATVRAAEPALGTTAEQAASLLKQTVPPQGATRLVHGTLYARHVIDMGDGVGVIDWDGFGQGPPEHDAGVFLATIWRIGLGHGPMGEEALRAERAFVEGTAGLLDGRAVMWFRAATLLHLAHKRARRWDGSSKKGEALVAEAERLGRSLA